MKTMATVLALALLCGCEKARQDMYVQPKLKPYAHTPLFADGAVGRPAVAGTQAAASGPFAASSSGRVGADEVDRTLRAETAPSNPYPVTSQLLLRGQERYQIYCMPCHSPVGDGDGLVVRRGFPAPPSFHQDRLRQAPDRYLYDVITHGYGIMYSYADRLAPPDRWAVVAYIRALQLSQHADAATLPAELQQRLRAAQEERP
jgi:mono/diheme cytochrome c family protein